MLSKEVSSTIFKVFGMTRPGIEPQSPRTLANTLPIRPMNQIESKSTLKNVTRPCCIMTNVLDHNSVINEFKLWSCYGIYFQTNTLEKGMNPYPLSHGLNITTSVLRQGWLWHEITHEGWYTIKNKETKPYE